MHCNKCKLDHTGNWRIMRETTKYQARCMEHRVIVRTGASNQGTAYPNVAMASV